MRKIWTAEEDALFREHYPNSTMKQMMELLGRSACSIYNRSEILNVRKSQEYLDSPAACRLRRGDNIGADFRFKKGQQVWNKGMKGLDLGGKETQFKPGTKPPNHKPVGTIRQVDGYYEIKIAEGLRKWKLLQRVVWERCNGKIPEGMFVIFLDGSRDNIDITNLSLVTKAQNMKRNTVHNYPKEIVHLVQLKAALNRQINKRTNHEQHRHA